MIKIGRLLFLVVVLVGIAVAILRLREQSVPFIDVAVTGLWYRGHSCPFRPSLGIWQVLGSVGFPKRLGR